MGNLYERLELLCKEKGVSRAQMCKDTGVSQGNISDLKMGRKHTFSAKTMAKLAEYFNVSISYLLGDSDEPFSPDGRKSTYYKLIQNGYVGEAKETDGGSLSITAEDFSDLAEVWNVLKDRPEAKMLFKSSKSATAEQIIETAKYLDYLKSKG